MNDSQRKAMFARKKRVDEIKSKVLPLSKHAKSMYDFHQGLAKRDRVAVSKWGAMSTAKRSDALKHSRLNENDSKDKLSKMRYVDLPHYVKTDLGFHYFKLNRSGNPI